MHPISRALRTVAIVVTMFFVQSALAQHAGFTLLGSPNPAAKDVPDEQKAVHPVSSPYFHEDSFITTDLRAWYLFHKFPGNGAIGGGHANLVAVQARVAITDSLQFVAYKDGYVFLNSSLVHEDGFMDVGAGLKWNFWQDWENQLHLAVGAGYEAAVGQAKVLQRDDEWRLWVSANKGFDRLHLGATFNVFLADDKSQGLGNSNYLSWHLHADYYACKWFSPVVEFNGYHVFANGTEVVPFSGVDVANLGGSSGDGVISAAFGGEIRPFKPLALRAAFEVPLTSNEDLYGYRVSISAIWSF